MSVQGYSELLAVGMQAALKAGEILRRGFGSAFEIKSKPGKQNLVTEFDHQAEACIISIIKSRFPTHSILAEESGFDDQQKDPFVWVIDPLDGTTNFTRQIPIISISIAVYHEDVLVCGIVFQPFTQEFFTAEKGKGAYLNGHRLQVSATSSIDNSLIVASLPYDKGSLPLLDIFPLLQLSQGGMTIRNLGSAALSLAYVAAGKVDAFWMYKLYPWDLAAGKLLIEESKGQVTLFEALESAPWDPANVLASNRHLHPILKKYLIHK